MLYLCASDGQKRKGRIGLVYDRLNVKKAMKSNNKPTKESPKSYPKLSEEAKDRILRDVAQAQRESQLRSQKSQ